MGYAAGDRRAWLAGLLLALAGTLACAEPRLPTPQAPPPRAPETHQYPVTATPSADTFERERAAMLRDIQQHVRSTRERIGRDALDPRVLDAMERVPRHELVPPELREHAYRDRPLPIGHGQTISQPFIVALMTDLLDPEPGDVVLDIGTGSGYQAAVLAELVEQVYGIEIVEPLGRAAQERLARLGYDNVEVRVGDGFHGWPEHAPFDGIVIAAAIGEIPPPLLEQLAPGGRLVLPRGDPRWGQDLVVVEKDAEGKVRERSVLPVRFVPMTGEH